MTDLAAATADRTGVFDAIPDLVVWITFKHGLQNVPAVKRNILIEIFAMYS